MKWYVGVALLIGGGVGLVCFYRFASHQGKMACERENYRQMLIRVAENQHRQQEVAEIVRGVQKKLERKTQNDKVCDDVLRFDVRGCL